MGVVRNLSGEDAGLRVGASSQFRSDPKILRCADSVPIRTRRTALNLTFPRAAAGLNCATRGHLTTPKSGACFSHPVSRKCGSESAATFCKTEAYSQLSRCLRHSKG